MKHLKTYEGFKYLKPKSKEEIQQLVLDTLNSNGDIDLSRLKELPEGFENYIFNNYGGVYLQSLTVLPEGITFNNNGGVYLPSLTVLPEGIKFNNNGGVFLSSLTTLPEEIEFNNNGNIFLNSLSTLHKGVKFNNKDFHVILKNGNALLIK